MFTAAKTAFYSCTESLESLLAVRSAIEEVVVHAGDDALLVQHVRDAAIDGTEHSALHLPLLAHLFIAFMSRRKSRTGYMVNETFSDRSTWEDSMKAISKSRRALGMVSGVSGIYGRWYEKWTTPTSITRDVNYTTQVSKILDGTETGEPAHTRQLLV